MFPTKGELEAWRKENGIKPRDVTIRETTEVSVVLRAIPELAAIYEELKGARDTNLTDEELVKEYMSVFSTKGLAKESHLTSTCLLIRGLNF